jgi:oligopeptide transport system ATP-binding protein
VKRSSQAQRDERVTDAATTRRPAGGETLLEVDDLAVEFDSERGVVRAVNGVSFQVRAGETLAIVGESGSGKSVTIQAVMGSIPIPPGRIASGAVRYRGRDLLTMAPSERRKLRGSRISMVTQDALTALNPTLTVGFQIGEMYRIHQGLSRKESRDRAVEMLRRVHIPDAENRVRQYPHQFSGGMQQRVMIAMALALDPEIVIADEPTTALDVTVQAQIMDLLEELQASIGMALVLITHDLALVSGSADRIGIMYGGRLVEAGTVPDVFHRPSHPYTRGLMHSVPGNARRAEDLHPIPGRPPDLVSLPPGCAYAPRCDRAEQRCVESVPPLVEVVPGRTSACFFAGEEYHDA